MRFLVFSWVIFFFCRTLSAGTAGAGVSVETGLRVKVTGSMSDTAAPAVVQPRLVYALHGRVISGVEVS